MRWKAMNGVRLDEVEGNEWWDWMRWKAMNGETG